MQKDKSGLSLTEHCCPVLCFQAVRGHMVIFELEIELLFWNIDLTPIKLLKQELVRSQKKGDSWWPKEK